MHGAGPRHATWRARALPGLAGAVLAALLCAACTSGPKPTAITGVVQASSDVNPSVSQRASPVLLRVYELKSEAAFNGADFISLYQRDQSELGADLVSREEFILNPGESRPWNKVASSETRFVGVLAAYRDIDHARWRAVVAIQPGQAQQLTIKAQALAVTATVGK